MNIINKYDSAYKTIGEVAKELNLIDKKTGRVQTHTLRYWETQFKQIKPRIQAGRRRYYSKESFAIIKQIKFLLKEKGLTIKGVKKALSKTTQSSIDGDADLGLYEHNLKSNKIIKEKLKKISKIDKQIKNFK